MAVNLTAAVCNARAQAIITAAGSGCTIKCYSGSAPANADTAVTGTLLATLTIAGVLGTATGGTITLGTVTSGTAVATNTCGYARLATSGGTAICDFTSISTTSGDLVLNTLTITSGGTVSISSGTIVEAYP